MGKHKLLQELTLFLDRHSGPVLKIMLVIDSLHQWGGFETYLLSYIRELKNGGHFIYVDFRNMSTAFFEQLLPYAELWENQSIEETVEGIQKENIDIIHSQPHAAAFRAAELSKKTGIPFVLTFHGPVIARPKMEYLLAAATKIVAVSQEVYGVLERLYPYAPSKTTIIQNGVQLSEFPQVNRKKSDGLSLMFVGRIDPDRNYGLMKLIEAYRHQSIFSELIIVGDGSKKESIEAIADPSIGFLGAVPNVRSIMYLADAIVATGRGCREAMSIGKPGIVLSNWGYDGLVCPSQIEKLEYANFSGRGVQKPLDTQLILQDLKVLEDIEVREKLGKFGMKLVQERYDIRHMTQQMIEVYQQAIHEFQDPTVSFILPVFNQAKWLPMAVRSILNQTLTNFELLIINDGSTDEFDEVAKTFQDNRIRILANDRNRKLPYTINKGILESKGKYITWTSADNIVLPHFAEQLVKVLEDHPLYGSAYSDYVQIDANGNVIQSLSKGAYKLDGKTNYGPSFLYQREAVQRVGLFDETLFGIEDRDYSIRIAIEAPVFWIPKVLYQYRMHEESLTGRFIKKEISFADSFRNFRAKWGRMLDRPSPDPGNLEVESVFKWGTEYVIPLLKDCTIHNRLAKNLDGDPFYIGMYKGVEYKQLLYFSLEDLPEEIDVLQASLELFMIRNDNAFPQSIDIYQVLSSWEEKQVHIHHMPNIANKPVKNGMVGQIMTWNSIDITSILLEWMTRGISNHGLLLAPSTSETKLMAAYNRHYFLPSLSPRIRVKTTGRIRGGYEV